MASYAYDALSRRVTEDHGTARHLYYSAAWQVLEERVGGETDAQYVWAPLYAGKTRVDVLVLRDRGSERLYVQQDGQGSVVALVSAAGTVVERYVYDAYGRPSVLTSGWMARI